MFVSVLTLILFNIFCYTFAIFQRWRSQKICKKSIAEKLQVLSVFLLTYCILGKVHHYSGLDGGDIQPYLRILVHAFKEQCTQLYKIAFEYQTLNTDISLVSLVSHSSVIFLLLNTVSPLLIEQHSQIQRYKCAYLSGKEEN